MDQLEIRHSGLYSPVNGQIETRINVEPGADEGEPTVIFGNAVPFNALSQPIAGEFREVIPAYATIDISDLVMLAHHRAEEIIGRESAQTLTSTRDINGLQVRAQTNQTTYVEDLIKNIRSGNIQGFSFGFRTILDNWFQPEALEDEYDGLPIRQLLHIQLVEISPVTFPAYVAGDIGVRSLAQFIEKRDKPSEQVETREEKQEIEEDHIINDEEDKPRRNLDIDRRRLEYWKEVLKYA